MAVVHMIHGFLGAGKTTYARHLETETGALRLSHDEWMSRLYGDDPPVDQFADFHARVSEQITDVWSECVARNVSVILDSGFWKRNERDQVRAAAKRLGAEVRLHALSCPEDVAWARIEARNTSLGGSLFISRSTFDLLKTRFERLGPDEQIWHRPEAQ